ncbi:Uu.00g013450.m01.CDS01 [Anthostomella pinea]|uniref:Uu.00g013450.m01.CDS01 n=1 Tax=Anthostomella pinea TaxID=933095 RepID=A0AAI8VSD3_9PEZI|nr:Uu.00g013450.m01.CDS01 [Anthostomella pinea]
MVPDSLLPKRQQLPRLRAQHQALRMSIPEFLRFSNEKLNQNALDDDYRAESDTSRTGQFEPPSRTPDPLGAYESPFKTSINNHGVTDADDQFPDYLTSFNTAVSSPSISGYLSIPSIGGGLDGFEQFSRLAVDGDAGGSVLVRQDGQQRTRMGMVVVNMLNYVDRHHDEEHRQRADYSQMITS